MIAGMFLFTNPLLQQRLVYNQPPKLSQGRT